MPSSRGILLTQGSNPHLLHWQADSLPLSHQGSPKGDIHVNKTRHAEEYDLSCSQGVNCPRYPCPHLGQPLTFGLHVHWPCLTPASFSVYTRLIELYLGSCTLTSKGILLKLSMSGQGSPSDWLTSLLSLWSRPRRKVHRAARSDWLATLPPSHPSVRETYSPGGWTKTFLRNELPSPGERGADCPSDLQGGMLALTGPH